MKLNTMKLCALALLLSLFGSLLSQGMPERPAELKKLEWMLGEWTGKWTWHIPGMEGEMTMTLKNEYEGHFIKKTSVMTMEGMTSKEACYMGWDASKRRFSCWTFTDFAPTPRIEHATMDGDKLIFISEPWDVGMPEGPIVSRATLTKKSDKEIVFLVEFKQGENWTKAADGSFKKK